jgi:hypothetical protein
MHADIHVSSGIQTHDPSVRAGEDGSCFRLWGHCGRPYAYIYVVPETGYICAYSADKSLK